MRFLWFLAQVCRGHQPQTGAVDSANDPRAIVTAPHSCGSSYTSPCENVAPVADGDFIRAEAGLHMALSSAGTPRIAITRFRL
jgi:hypothetical protein